nr:MAG TPA: hypothetical protein [Caudoviricetes sp.]
MAIYQRLRMLMKIHERISDGFKSRLSHQIRKSRISGSFLFFGTGLEKEGAKRKKTVRWTVFADVGV